VNKINLFFKYVPNVCLNSENERIVVFATILGVNKCGRKEKTNTFEQP